MLQFPFCPNPACIHHSQAPEQSWCSRIGSYRSRLNGIILRYRCCSCGRTFSTQTFHASYYLKRPPHLEAIFGRSCEGQSGRAIARALELSPASVMNRIDRLARQSLALHSRLRPFARRSENVCIDGFVSFDQSQFSVSELAISITSNSRFILELSHASRRRSGTMTSAQKRKAKDLYARMRFERGAIGRSFRELLDSLARERPPSRHAPLVIITDEKPEYARAFHRHTLFRDQDDNRRTAHATVNSHLPRTTRNPLFASNYLDREIRKDQANHRRESTCFSRRAANGLSRMACYLAHHNYWKKYLIKGKADDRRVHADEAGVPREVRLAGMEGFFERRAFLSRETLSIPMERTWRKAVPTPGILHAAYLPAFALA